MNRIRKHWEDIFRNKSDQQKSWYQSYPSTSMKWIEELHLPETAALIDIGGGDSRLVDALLQKGYSNITVLDISAAAIENVKRRLGKDADKVNWVVSDVLEYKPDKQFDLWHDRAAFHFLTLEDEIKTYVDISERGIVLGGHLILGTFSEKGPRKCSGLDTKQYSSYDISARFHNKFEKIKCEEEDHVTPSGTVQHFLFCSFKKVKQ